MRNWLNIINEAQSSVYGYWISPTGDRFIIQYQAHETFITNFTGLSYYEAIDNGWIRVVSPSNRNYWNFELAKTTKEAFTSLRELLNEYPDLKAFIDLWFSDNPISFSCANNKQTIAVIRAYLSNTLFTNPDLVRFRVT